MPMTRAEIATLVAASLPDNTSRYIEPAHIRAVVTALLEAATLDAESPWVGAIEAALGGVRAIATVRQVAAIDYALEATDAEALIEFIADAAVTVTLPADADAAFPAGASIHLCGAGGGGLAFAAGAGATLALPKAPRPSWSDRDGSRPLSRRGRIAGA